jgi:hypothetical protein
VKAYGIADGVLVGLAIGAFFSVLFVLLNSQQYWLLPVAFVVLIAAGVLFAVRVGRPLVDGAFLPPRLRRSLIGAVLISAIAAPAISLQRQPGKPPPHPPSPPVPAEKIATLKTSICDEVRKGFDQVGTDLAKLDPASRDWAGLQDRLLQVFTRNLNNGCGFDEEIKKAGESYAVKVQPLATTEEKKNALQRVRTALSQPPPKPQPVDEGASPKPPEWLGGDKPLPPDVVEPPPPSQPATQPRPPSLPNAEDENLLQTLMGWAASLAWGPTKVTREEIGGVLRSTIGGGNGEALAVFLKDHNDPLLNEALRIAARRLASRMTDPAKKKVVETVLNGDAETFLCHYVLAQLPNAPDPAKLKQIEPTGDLDEVVKTPTDAQWTDLIGRVEKCVYRQDSINFAFYNLVFEQLRQRRARVSA